MTRTLEIIRVEDRTVSQRVIGANRRRYASDGEAPGGDPDDEDDPYAFRLDFSEFGIGTTRVVFSRDPGAGPTRLSLEIMPVSLRKQPAMTNPRLWATGALGALGVTSAAIAIRQLRR